MNIQTNRLKDVICHEGYQYIFDKMSADKVKKYYRCRMRNINCKGRMYLMPDGTIHVTGNHGGHDESPVDVEWYCCEMYHTMVRVRKNNTNKGSGVVNSLINHLPVELHLPGYRFCGPGTKLRERLARGERGINSLDELAREHDIAYENSNLLADRHKADKILEKQAWEVFKSKNSGLKEKAASWLVTTAMKAKRKMDAGCLVFSGL